MGAGASVARRHTLLLAGHLEKFAEAAFVIFEDHVALHEVLEFAQVARPWITQRGFEQMLRRLGSRLLIFLAVFDQKMAEQQRNFRGALAQRRNVDRKHVQAVIKVLAETAGAHRFLHVHVRGGQNAHVHVDHGARAQPRILAVLQDVQKFCLQVRAHLRDFVEKDRALVGQLEFAGLGANRAGERSLLVTEKLRFQKFAGQRGAVHFDETPAAAAWSADESCAPPLPCPRRFRR